MNNYEAFLVELLQDKIKYEDKVVEVRRTFLPRAELPCITLNISSDTIEKYFYSFEDTEKRYALISSDMTINTWSNTEEARERINEQIQDLFIQALNHHYKYCTQYSDGNCSKTNMPCSVTTIRNNRTVKEMCPDPDLYNYESLMKKYGIVDGTAKIDPPFHNDEYNEHPPILHSIHKTSCYYIDLLSSRGVTGEGIKEYKDLLQTSMDEE